MLLFFFFMRQYMDKFPLRRCLPFNCRKKSYAKNSCCSFNFPLQNPSLDLCLTYGGLTSLIVLIVLTFRPIIYMFRWSSENMKIPVKTIMGHGGLPKKWLGIL